MIIGYDGSRAFNKQKTGTENYSYQLLKALREVDRKNTYIVYLRPAVKIDRDKWPKNFTFKNIGWHIFWTQLGLARQTFIDKLDILFIPAHTLPLIYKKGLKTVVTVHDLGSEYLPKLHQLKQRFYLRIMQQYQLKKVSFIIAVSKATRDDLVKKCQVSPEKIQVVYEAYNKYVFRIINNRAVNDRLRYYDLERDKYFLFVGTIQPRKNIERIIIAFNRYLARGSASVDFSSKLVIAGSRGWMSDEIYKLPKKLRIEDKVSFLGYVPERRLPALYIGAKALVFPSLFEGFGLPILEAQACGCPVITSNISSMPEVAGKEGAILVDPYSVEQISEAISKVEDEKIRRELVKKGLENAKRFSWERCALHTLEVLEKMATY